MSKTELVARSWIIAEFMNLKPMEWVSPWGDSMQIWINKETELTEHDEPDLQYHYNWNWIMPVWVKFKKLYDELALMDDSFSRARQFTVIKLAIVDGDIDITFSLLSTEIKWYNNSKS